MLIDYLFQKKLIGTIAKVFLGAKPGITEKSNINEASLRPMKQTIIIEPRRHGGAENLKFLIF